jgi:hypothetical protein
MTPQRIYEYVDKRQAENGTRLEIDPGTDGALCIDCVNVEYDWQSHGVALPPDEQLKLFQALAAHLTQTDKTPGLSYFTNWLTSFLSSDDLLVISRGLINYALAAKGEKGVSDE